MHKFLIPEHFPVLPLHKIVATAHLDYDKLDRAALSKGYIATDPRSDEKVDTSDLLVGIGNAPLHCGWICTVDDSRHLAQDMVKLLNTKAEIVRNRSIDFIVGFCRTGNFSVGYTLYVKK